MNFSDYINARVAVATCEGVSVAWERKGERSNVTENRKKPED